MRKKEREYVAYSRKKLLQASITIVLLFSVIQLSFFLLPVSNAYGEHYDGSWTKYRYDNMCTGLSPLVSNIQEPQIKWKFPTVDHVKSSPTVGDINNDGELEVVFGSNDRCIYATDLHGNLIWSYEIDGWIVNSPTIGDVDGDGMPEIVFGGFWLKYLPDKDPNLYVLNGEDGSLLWSFTSEGYNERGFQASATLYDINYDGILDILIGSMDHYFYVFNGPNGDLIWRSDIFEHFIRASSPIDDIDQDGDMEVVVIDNNGNVRVLRASDGRFEWERNVGDVVEATPLIEDLDGDGYVEIVCFTVMEKEGIGGAVVLNYDGTLLWNNNEHLGCYTSPVVVDIDQDGLLDIVGGDSDDHTIVAYKGNTGDILWETVLEYSWWSQAPLVIVDIDNDMIMELIAGAKPNLYCINTNDGSIDWIFETTMHIWGQPTIADLEEDGLAEILFGCYDNYLYVLEEKLGNEPPVAEFEIYQNVEITAKITGRKGNTIIITVLEDGIPIEIFPLYSQTGNSNGDHITFILKKKLGSSYSLKFEYIGYHGSNPVIVNFGADENNKPLNINFNSGKGLKNSATINIDDYLKNALSGNRKYIFDASQSYDPDGIIINYYWDFGDGTSESSMIVEHEYLRSGIYIVTLNVSDQQESVGSKDLELFVS